MSVPAMKASALLILSAFCICASTYFSLGCLRPFEKDHGAAEFPKLGTATSRVNLTGWITTTSKAKKRQVTFNSASEHNASNPYLRIEFGYKRTGTVSAIHHGLSFDGCVQACHNHPHRCIGVNYLRYKWICEELEKLGDIEPDSHYVTRLVNYKRDDPCDKLYFQKSFDRPGFQLISSVGEIAKSPRDCCSRCLEDPDSKCKAWTYFSKTKSCYLREIAAPLVAASAATSGYGVFDSSSALAES